MRALIIFTMMFWVAVTLLMLCGAYNLGVRHGRNEPVPCVHFDNKSDAGIFWDMMIRHPKTWKT